jgi:hypothetical protein
MIWDLELALSYGSYPATAGRRYPLESEGRLAIQYMPTGATASQLIQQLLPSETSETINAEDTLPNPVSLILASSNSRSSLSSTFGSVFPRQQIQRTLKLQQHPISRPFLPVCPLRSSGTAPSRKQHPKTCKYHGPHPHAQYTIFPPGHLSIISLLHPRKD